jgi:hypothetical protein
VTSATRWLRNGSPGTQVPDNKERALPGGGRATGTDFDGAQFDEAVPKVDLEENALFDLENGHFSQDQRWGIGALLWEAWR